MGMLNEMAGISDSNYKLKPGVTGTMTPAGAQYLSCIVAAHNRYLASANHSAGAAKPEARGCGAEVDRVFQLKRRYDTIPSSKRGEKRKAAKALEEQQLRAVECAHNETNNSAPDPYITKLRNNFKVN